MKVTDAHLELTNYCNLACAVCPNKSMKRAKAFMPSSMVFHIVATNPQLREVGLSVWGEPLLHPELLLIIDHLCNHGLHVLAEGLL
jgi:MoaA/NifB/PqqE/SkfB family radical SAM enzyme